MLMVITSEVARAIPAAPIIFESKMFKMMFKATQIALIKRGVVVFLKE